MTRSAKNTSAVKKCISWATEFYCITASCLTFFLQVAANWPFIVGPAELAIKTSVSCTLRSFGTWWLRTLAPENSAPLHRWPRGPKPFYSTSSWVMFSLWQAHLNYEWRSAAEKPSLCPVAIDFSPPKMSASMRSSTAADLVWAAVLARLGITLKTKRGFCGPVKQR